MKTRTKKADPRNPEQKLADGDLVGIGELHAWYCASWDFFAKWLIAEYRAGRVSLRHWEGFTPKPKRSVTVGGQEFHFVKRGRDA